ncbi:MAG: hypothetical protein WD827_02115 [Solirubrobacterales bacterium]
MSSKLTPLSTYAQIGRTYLRWAPFLLVLAVIVFVPVGLIHALTVSAEIGSFDVDGLVHIFAVMAALMALVITGLLGEVFYTGAVAVSLTHSHQGKPPSLRQIATTIDYGRLIVIDLVYGVLVAVGLILFVAPGVAAFVWLALAAPVVEIEHRGVRAAFARSVQLIRGRFWLALAVLVPIELVGDIVTNLMTFLAHDLLGETLLSRWLADVLSNLAFTPFYAVAAVLLTVSLIKEKDGHGPQLHSAPASA